MFLFNGLNDGIFSPGRYKLLSDDIHVLLISGKTRIYYAAPTMKFFVGSPRMCVANHYVITVKCPYGSINDVSVYNIN